MQATALATSQSFESALECFRAGDRMQSAIRCRGILSEVPNHCEANHLLGVLHLLDGDPSKAELLIQVSLSITQTAAGESDLGLALRAQKRYEEAMSAQRRALDIDPGFAIAYSNLARLHEEQNQLEQARAAFHRAVELDPNSADYRFNFGRLLSRLGNGADALEQLRRAIMLRPNWPEALNSLGSVLAEQRMFDDAESAFRHALEIRPGFAQALCNLGSLFKDTGRKVEAEQALRHSLRADPQFAGASEMLARLLNELGRSNEAIDTFRMSLQLSPNNVGTLNALGSLLAEKRRFEEAEMLLRRALELSPRFVLALINLANILAETRRTEAAEAAYRHALDVDPNHWGALFNFGAFLKNLRKLDEAEVLTRRVLELQPRLAAAHVGLGTVLLAKNSGNIGEALNCFRSAIEIDPDCLIAHSNLVYALSFVSEAGYDVLEEGRRFAARFEAPLAAAAVQYRNDPAPERRLRIGYVSPDFRDHCQSLFMLPLLRNHDHRAVEVFCYSSVEIRDRITDEIAHLADAWRDAHTLDDEQLARQIRDDRIDILVDLTMHMAGGRPQLFARKPAPVQVAWLAYPGTTGSSAIEYRLTDPWLDPADSNRDDCYSETSIRLPDTFWCYAPLNLSHHVNALPADDKGHITFGCLNNPCKLTDRTFALWAEAMRRIPGSTLMLLLAWGRAREEVVAKFEAAGIEASRLYFVDYRPRERYMDTYLEIDIVLDTFPYNGHTTSLDALWMGVPVLTMTGQTPASRAGHALLSNLSMPDWIADSEESFIEKAVEAARDLSGLRKLRSELRTVMERSALMDGARFARGMERAFQLMWREHCALRLQPNTPSKTEVNTMLTHDVSC
ncbi:tetratricopeptide repeat protein [Caballeronia sp. LZ034LL]|uniref:tetratricopeptide repeat protein n=1 Tax=Caballeronia sp. LZ034LL TaxID=3038567 RepID=UPI0028551DC4|nr:tetratricopeptide repeat protein [Caballeronia sp. LZ034LL]MDR5834816.1 tetratricopeptide repeat protein [Caballeronia sp. LZ034LL]